MDSGNLSTPPTYDKSSPKTALLNNQDSLVARLLQPDGWEFEKSEWSTRNDKPAFKISLHGLISKQHLEMKQVCSQLTFETLPGLASRRKKTSFADFTFYRRRDFFVGRRRNLDRDRNKPFRCIRLWNREKHFSPRKLIVQAFTFVFDLSLGCIWNS